MVAKQRAPWASVWFRVQGLGFTKRSQYHLIKEYTVNYRGLHIMVYKVYSLIKGYWDLWAVCHARWSESLALPAALLQALRPSGVHLEGSCSFSESTTVITDNNSMQAATLDIPSQWPEYFLTHVRMLGLMSILVRNPATRLGWLVCPKAPNS